MKCDWCQQELTETYIYIMNKILFHLCHRHYIYTLQNDNLGVRKR